MTPIFFHLESHLWIAYLFFFNGLLVNWLLRSYSPGYAELTKPFEAQVLAAFFISISINGGLLYGLDLVDLNFGNMRFILPIVTVGLILISIWRFTTSDWRQPLLFNFGIARLGLYVFVFVILFYNGGLIELLADSWWHMSLASKIASSSTLNLDFGHLNGVHRRYYPPLWHGNLALAHLISGESMAVLWNSFTAWGGVLKVMGFYLLALALSGKQSIAILSAAFFILLPGIGDSYLRVSAWPSHIAYTAMFTVFYVIFGILDTNGFSKKHNIISLKAILWGLFEERAKFLCVLVLLVIILFSHQAELLWLVVAFLFYWMGVSVLAVFADSKARRCESAFGVVRTMGLVVLLSSVLASIWFISSSSLTITSNIDLSISYWMPVLVMLVFLYTQLSMQRQTAWLASKIYRKAFAQLLLIVAGITLVCSVDLRHVISLFNPELAYPRGASHEYSLIAQGWFGGNLAIPGWHLQLRGGLLYSGVASIPLSLYLAITRPSRLTVFLASTGMFAFLFCSSPYLYQWLKDILNYHSPWRIGIIIFHPIVFATACCIAWQVVSNFRDARNA